MNFDVEKYRVNFLIMERATSVNDGLDYSGDAAAGSFFSTDYKKNDDLKQMLDSNRDNLKLEAMKRIIGMVAKGRDASDLFPAVVKNVVSKNTEVKKLVYVYLMRYAEEQQDLALLSISTFQRALKDPNQLIRASALRVLSSIRVPVIVPIVMLAIRDASADMSPYVRKTAAHAIPKLYSLDPDQKDELITILDKLLADKTTLVVGSAVMAFEEVCPDRVDMIHKNYRKLCSLLVDVDEWGQVVILNMLTRYARSQFVDPNLGDMSVDGEEKPFYEDEENEDDTEEDEDEKPKKEVKAPKPQMDPDHALLLKNSRPLLQSRNASVVMAVVQLYYHCAPRAEVPIVVKAMIRLLRSHVEVQAVVLTCIAAMSTDRKSLFEPYMKSFYVRSSDPTQIKLLKLEILTNIANETNIPPILREFQTYISSSDKKFVAATIQAIGRCASNIKEVAETCLNGLVSLLSHRDPTVVGGAVVVAKTLLQTQKKGVKSVIAQLARMVDRVTVPPARAAILWLLGEHCERLPKLPPDVLRKMAKSFANEEDIVKLQIINLAAKLQLTNPEQTTLLCQYVLNLAKYDQNYDIRDRARFLRHLLFPEDPSRKICQLSKKILMSSKPAPVLQSKFKDRDHFQLGSLSHFLNMRANGYIELPDFPKEAPDPSVRNVEPPAREKHENMYDGEPEKKSKKKAGASSSSKKTAASFYSDESEEKSEDESGSGSGTDDSESDSSSGDEEEEDASSCCSDGDSTEDEEKSDDEDGEEPQGEVKTKAAPAPKPPAQRKKVVRYSENSDASSSKEGSDSDESSGSSSSSSSASGSRSSSQAEDEDRGGKTKKGKVLTRTEEKIPKKTKEPVKSAKAGLGKTNNKASKPAVTESLLLLDLDANDNDQGTSSSSTTTTTNPSMNPVSFDMLKPVTASNNIPKDSALHSLASLESASAMYVPTKTVELLNKIATGGLQIYSRFTRSPHIASSSMVSVELTITNTSSKETFKKIRIGNKAPGMSIHEFEEVEVLEPGKQVQVTLGIDFNDTTQGAKMDIMWATESEPGRKQNVTIRAPVGELIRAVSMSEALFIAEQGKLRGMHEHDGRVSLNSSLLTGNSTQNLVQKVYMTGNLLQVPSTQDDLVRFAGQTVSGKTVVLVTIYLPKPKKEGEDADDGGSSSGSTECRVVVNCEKIVIGSMLLQELKEALK